MKYIIFIFILIFTLSCDEHEDNSAPNEILVSKDLVVNENFVDSAFYVFLDNSVLIGKIARLIVYDNKIFIHDDIGDKIIIYSLRGNYLFHIDSKGKGPMEYVKITDFTINKSSDNIVIFDSYLHKIIIYSIEERKFISEQKLELYPTAFAYCYNKYFFYNPYTINYPQNKELHYSLISTNQNLKNYNMFFKINEGMGSFMSDPNSKGFFYGQNLLFLNRFDNIIYAITEKGVTEAYKIIFKENEGYEQAVKDAIAKNTRSVESYQNSAREINNFCETDKYISFVYKRQKRFYWSVYAKENDSIILNIYQYPGPSKLMMEKNVPIILPPEYVSQNWFIKVLNNHTIIQARSLFDDNLTNTELLKNFKNFKVDNNPVIVFYRYDFKE